MVVNNPMLVMIDLDNTLCDRSAAVEAWAVEFAKKHGLSRQAIDWIIEIDNDGYSQRSEVFTAIAERFAIGRPVERLLTDYRRRVIELTVPTPGAIECLAEMRSRGWMTVILSNGSSGQQHGKIDVLRLRPLVDGVCVSGDVDVKKPAAEIFRIAAHAVGTEVVDTELVDGSDRDIWMVGDSPRHDIVGAAQLGLSTAWLDRGRTWQEQQAALVTPDVEPTLTIGSLAELVPAIDSVKAS